MKTPFSMFESASLSALYVTALSASTLFHSIGALPLHSSSDDVVSKGQGDNLDKSLRARAPCGDTCDTSITSYSSTTTTTATWASAATQSPDSSKTCTPNFQGVAVRVSPAGGDSSWCIPAVPGQAPGADAQLESLHGSGTTFRIEQTGRAEMDFIIKLGGIGNNSLILAPMGDHIGLCDINAAAQSSFKIACNSCFYGDIKTGTEELASGCTIMACSSGMYMTETNGTMCMQAQSTSSSSTSSAVQLFDIVASDKTRVVDGPTDGECDDDECYEDDGNEIEQGETNDTDNECDECEKANEGQFEVVDPPSCDEDLGCSDQGN